MTQQYTKDHPFIAKIKERYSLCQQGSAKNTQHIVLDLAGSGLHYEVGDSIGVWPVHDPLLVQSILSAMGASGEESVQDKRSGVAWALREYLARKANLSDISRKMLQSIHDRQTNPEKRLALELLLKDENHHLLKEYAASIDLLDLLEQQPEVKFTPQELVNLLMPLMPRFYSIASSKNVVGEEVHLTVALKQFSTDQRKRVGVCTHFLCNLAPKNEACIPVYVHPHKGFTLPQDPNSSLIMIGPGTGIAPYRAFMQERESRSDMGKNWLFFGEWNRSRHFFYEDYWKSLEAQGKIKIDAAFSRDQEHKIYVQHKMAENGPELFQWLENGAYFYVCGDATRMAKDVEEALHKILQKHGALDEEGSKAYIKRLKLEKRYLRDVY